MKLLFFQRLHAFILPVRLLVFSLVSLFLFAYSPVLKGENNKLRIVFTGDLLIPGSLKDNPRVSLYPDLVQKDLIPFGIEAEVIIDNNTGSTSNEGVKNINRLLELKPGIVVIMYGTRDAFIEEGNTAENVPVAVFRRNIENMISQLRDAGISPILMAPPPLGEFRTPLPEPYHSKGLDFFYKPYVAACREISFNHSISLVDHFQDWTGKKENGVDCSIWLEDGIHPGKSGHEIMARIILPAVLRECIRKPVTIDFIKDGKIKDIFSPGKKPDISPDAVNTGGIDGDLFAAWMPSKGDFTLNTIFRIDQIHEGGMTFRLAKSDILIDPLAGSILLKGEIAGNKIQKLPLVPDLSESGTYKLEIIYEKNVLSVRLNNLVVYSSPFYGNISGIMGFVPGMCSIGILNFSAKGTLVKIPVEPKSYSIPFADLSKDLNRQVIVDREEGQYLGHVTTITTPDGAIHAFYPKGHGRGAIVHKKSIDAGLNWSERLPLPENFSGSLEVPTIFGIPLPDGNTRHVLFSGLYPARFSISEDRCSTFTPLKPAFNYGGIVVMSDMIRLNDGSYMCFFHDDGKYYKPEGRKSNEFTVFKTVSCDNGLSWSDPEVLLMHKSAHLCEGGAIRSPDGSTITLLLRENSRTYNSMVTFSTDEGKTWSEPEELPASLTGDRHTIRYAKDGRIVMVFRDQADLSPFKGDFVAWVGTWDDIFSGNEGQYRIRLLDNTWEYDCGYGGLELLPDGSFLATTYGHWDEGAPPYIRCIRFNLNETDQMISDKILKK